MVDNPVDTGRARRMIEELREDPGAVPAADVRRVAGLLGFREEAEGMSVVVSHPRGPETFSLRVQYHTIPWRHFQFILASLESALAREET